MSRCRVASDFSTGPVQTVLLIPLAAIKIFGCSLSQGAGICKPKLSTSDLVTGLKQEVLRSFFILLRLLMLVTASVQFKHGGGSSACGDHWPPHLQVQQLSEIEVTIHSICATGRSPTLM